MKVEVQLMVSESKPGLVGMVSQAFDQLNPTNLKLHFHQNSYPLYSSRSICKFEKCLSRLLEKVDFVEVLHTFSR